MRVTACGFGQCHETVGDEKETNYNKAKVKTGLGINSPEWDEKPGASG
jgi:hypothetical protein